VKLGVNHETIFPGGRSSLPHAHSEDEEFVFVIEGRPSLWIDGELRELAAGLCLIAMLGVLAGRWESTAPAFFSFLPVVFVLLCQKIHALSKRVEELERSNAGERTTPG